MMVYAPCEHGKVGQHALPCRGPHKGETCPTCEGGRPLGTVEEIEGALALLRDDRDGLDKVIQRMSAAIEDDTKVLRAKSAVVDRLLAEHTMRTLADVEAIVHAYDNAERVSVEGYGIVPGTAGTFRLVPEVGDTDESE